MLYKQTSDDIGRPSVTLQIVPGCVTILLPHKTSINSFCFYNQKKIPPEDFFILEGRGLSFPMQVSWSNGRVFHERMALIPLQSHPLLATALLRWLCGAAEQMKSLFFNVIPNKISRTVPNLHFDWKQASVEVYAQLPLEGSIPLQLIWSHVVQKVGSKTNPETKQKMKCSHFHYLD